MDIFDRFATDKKLELEGVVHQLDAESTVTVARWTNPAAMKLNAKLRERYLPTLQSPDEDVVLEQNKAITIEVLATHVLLGWTGLTYKGEDFPHSVSNATTLLKHEDFRELVLRVAMNSDNYRAKRADATEKN